MSSPPGSNEGVADTDRPVPEQNDQGLREEAERHLRALAGDHARLRDDQWTAISALVAARRRALVVQRTGWGKSAVYFVATALLRARGAGPTVIVSPLLALMRNQVEAAGRAGIHARTINSANTEEWDHVYAEVADGQADVLLVSPERLNNPWLPRPGAAEAHRRGGPDRDRRGTLHLRLGPRLPPRLPADPHAAAGSSAGDPGAGDHRDRERPGHPRRRRATRRGPRPRRRPRAARPAGPGVAAPRGGEPADRPPAARLAGDPARRRRLAGIRDHLHADGRRGLRDGGVPARPGNRRRRVQRPRRGGAAAAGRGRPAGQPGQGAGGDQRAWDGFRQARPGVRGAPRCPAVPGRLLPADRPGGPGRSPSGGDHAARPRGPGHLGVLRLARVPARAPGPGGAHRARRSGPAAVHRRA